MKQNLTRKPVISRFLGFRHNTDMTGQNWHNFFSVRERFMRSWAINLMIFKYIGLGLEKVVLVLS